MRKGKRKQRREASKAEVGVEESGGVVPVEFEARGGIKMMGAAASNWGQRDASVGGPRRARRAGPAEPMDAELGGAPSTCGPRSGGIWWRWPSAERDLLVLAAAGRGRGRGRGIQRWRSGGRAGTGSRGIRCPAHARALLLRLDWMIWMQWRIGDADGVSDAGFVRGCSVAVRLVRHVRD